MAGAINGNTNHIFISASSLSMHKNEFQLADKKASPARNQMQVKQQHRTALKGYFIFAAGPMATAF